MRIRPGILIVIAVMFGVLFAARYLGWFGPKPTDAATNVETPADTGHEPSPPDVPSTSPAPAGNRPRPVIARPPQIANRNALPTPAPAAGQIADWEQRVDDVLTGPEDENLKAKRLLDIFPNLPEEGQVEAAQHISNLMPDEQYASLAPTLTNALTPEAVLDVLMTDVLNRPNPVKLSTLLEVARTPQHPKAEEARDVLEVFVDENFGEDWAAWDAAVQKWLKENPDE